MNLKKILFVAGLAVASFSAYAQEEVETEYVFNPHWYVQGQFGLQHTIGEISWSDLNSPNLQVAGGYQFTPVWGARLALNTWQSKGGLKIHSLNKDYKYKWNYIAPTVDATMSLTNLILGYNPTRLVNAGLFAGIGFNVAFNNDEAADVKAAVTAANAGIGANSMAYLWDGSKASFVAQFGANVDFRINDNWSAGVEMGFNTLSDKYNSKKAKNSDWYYNMLAGVKYSFGKTYSKKTRSVAPCEPQIIEKEVIKEVIKEVPVKVEEPKAESIRRDIFFVLRGSEVSVAEMPKIEDIAAYLNKYPSSKVTITGYADKGTGNPKINVKYSEARAKKVADILINKFGIAASRIVYLGKGDAEQPYPAQNDLNRVSVCIAE